MAVIATGAESAMGQRQDRPTVRASVAADFRSSRAGQRLALIGVVGWLLYEWGAGNEIVTPWLVANVIGRHDGLAAIPMAALVGFCFTTAQQLASGFTALTGFSMFERTSRAAWQRLQRRTGASPRPWADLRPGARAMLVFGLGASAVALLEIVATGNTGVRRHRRAITAAALLCGAMVGIIAALAASLAAIGRSVSALAPTTDWIIRVLGNPLLWLGVLALGLAVEWFRHPKAAAPVSAA